MKQINLALCGFGTVGQAVYNLINENRELISKRTEIDFHIKKILVKNINKKRNIENFSGNFTTDINEIFNDPTIDIIVELIGGINTAKELIVNAFKNKKSVVTANKAVLATNGYELAKEAEKNKVDLFFEASVAGGIPIIRVFKETLLSNKINYFYGILNGTCNYILTEMTEKKINFNEALKEAQNRGYAESDPTFDIEGIDAAHKLAILIMLAYNFKFDFNNLYVEGISKISDKDIKFADEFGYSVRLLAIAKNKNGDIEGRVHPVLIRKDSILANIKGVYNAIYVKSDFLGPTLYYGKGAGGNPTATSVVTDIIEAGLNILKKSQNMKPVFTVKSRKIKKQKIKSINKLKTKYYLRFSVADMPGVLSKISGILGKNNISIEAVIQKGRVDNHDNPVPIVMITHESYEKDIKNAIKSIDTLNISKNETFFIRIEDFNG